MHSHPRAKLLANCLLCIPLSTPALSQQISGALQFSPIGISEMATAGEPGNQFILTRTSTVVLNPSSSTVWWCYISWTANNKDGKIGFPTPPERCIPKRLSGPADAVTQPIPPGRHLLRSNIPRTTPPPHGVEFYVWITESSKANEFHYCASTNLDMACTTIRLPPL